MFKTPWKSEYEKRHGFDYPDRPMRPYDHEAGCLVVVKLTSWGDHEVECVAGNTWIPYKDDPNPESGYCWFEEVPDELDLQSVWPTEGVCRWVGQTKVMLQHGLCPGDFALVWFHIPYWSTSYDGEGDVSYDWDVIATVKKVQSERARRWWTAWALDNHHNLHNSDNAVKRAHRARRGAWHIEYAWYGENIWTQDRLSITLKSTISLVGNPRGQRCWTPHWGMKYKDLASFSMNCENSYDRGLSVAQAKAALFESVRGKLPITEEEFNKLPNSQRH